MCIVLFTLASLVYRRSSACVDTFSMPALTSMRWAATSSRPLSNGLPGTPLDLRPHVFRARSLSSARLTSRAPGTACARQERSPLRDAPADQLRRRPEPVRLARVQYSPPRDALVDGQFRILASRLLL